MNILIATGSFKESVDAPTVAAAIARGLRRVWPEARIVQAPFVDGGEGFTRSLVDVTDGRIFACRVTGPVGEPVESFFGVLGDGEVGVIEMAAAAGLRLVPRDQRNPLATTTYGVGELIQRALDHGCRRLLIGCGDSGTNDGGIGMAQALGARFLDENGQELDGTGEALLRLATIDLSGLDPRLCSVPITAACNLAIALCGRRGVARAFGPQKGADPATVALLEAGLQRLATVVARELGLDVRRMPGSGAAGGLGAGLLAFLGAELVSSVALMSAVLNIEEKVAAADLVVTGEWQIDAGTMMDKVPHYVGSLCQAHGVPAVALAGSLGPGAEGVYQHGIQAIFTIVPHPSPVEEAFSQVLPWTVDAAERLGRTLQVGRKLDSAPLKSLR